MVFDGRWLLHSNSVDLGPVVRLHTYLIFDLDLELWFELDLVFGRDLGRGLAVIMRCVFLVVPFHRRTRLLGLMSLGLKLE